MARAISTEELKKRIDNHEKIYLIDVLSPQSYKAHHIPTAINIVHGADLPKKVAELGAAKNDEVIVYCSSATCGASPAAAMALERAGYTDVVHYKDGLAGWRAAGYEFAA